MAAKGEKGTVVWMRAGDERSLCVARFEVLEGEVLPTGGKPGREGRVHVLALTGAASFIDAEMTRFDAREAYRSLQKRGFVKFDGAGWSKARLSAVIRD